MDVVALLAPSGGAPRPRMPRIELNCTASLRHEGEGLARARREHLTGRDLRSLLDPASARRRCRGQSSRPSLGRRSRSVERRRLLRDRLQPRLSGRRADGVSSGSSRATSRRRAPADQSPITPSAMLASQRSSMLRSWPVSGRQASPGRRKSCCIFCFGGGMLAKHFLALRAACRTRRRHICPAPRRCGS